MTTLSFADYLLLKPDVEHHVRRGDHLLGLTTKSAAESNELKRGSPRLDAFRMKVRL